jgi:hypothetical protein
MFVPALPPNVTEVANWRSVPLIVTTVPPEVGPLRGETLVIVGAAAMSGEKRNIAAVKAIRRSDAVQWKT